MNKQKPKLSRFSIRKICRMCNCDEDKVIYCAHCNNTGLEPEQNDTNVVLSDLEKPLEGEGKAKPNTGYEKVDILDMKSYNLGIDAAMKVAQGLPYETPLLIDRLLKIKEMSEQTKLSVEEAFDKWLENQGGCTSDIYPDFLNAFIAGHTHALASSNMVELDRVVHIIECKREVWQDKAPMYDLIVDELTDLITQIKNLTKE